jgi:hypothetical protein
MKTQSQAVINFVINLAKEKGYSAKEFETDYKTVLSKEDVNTVVEMTFAGLQSGSISMTDASQAKFADDDKALRRYVVGLVNDRLRKAKAINGNTVYQYKEPGKNRFNKDATLKALNQVLELHRGTDAEAEIQEAIDARIAEVGQTAPKKVTINYDALPDDLRAKLNI